MGADAADGGEAAKEARLAKERGKLFERLQAVLTAHPSSACLAAQFPGALPLCMSQDQIQHALEIYCDPALLPSDASGMRDFAASLRLRLLAAAGIGSDPLLPECGSSAIPDHLYMADRSQQIVQPLRNILIWEVNHLTPDSCTP